MTDRRYISLSAASGTPCLFHEGNGGTDRKVDAARNNDERHADCQDCVDGRLEMCIRDRYRDIFVKTSFGETHLVETGNTEGPALLVFHGGNSTTAYHLLMLSLIHISYPVEYLLVKAYFIDKAFLFHREDGGVNPNVHQYEQRLHTYAVPA